MSYETFTDSNSPRNVDVEIDNNFKTNGLENDYKPNNDETVSRVENNQHSDSSVKIVFSNSDLVRIILYFFKNFIYNKKIIGRVLIDESLYIYSFERT